MFLSTGLQLGGGDPGAHRDWYCTGVSIFTAPAADLSGAYSERDMNRSPRSAACTASARSSPASDLST